MTTTLATSPQLELPILTAAERLAVIKQKREAEKPLVPDARQQIKLVLHLAILNNSWQFNAAEGLVKLAAGYASRLAVVTKKASYPVICPDCGTTLGSCTLHPLFPTCGCQGHGLFMYAITRVAAAAQGERYNGTVWKELEIIAAEVLTEWHQIKQYTASRRERDDNGTNTHGNNTTRNDLSPATGSDQQSELFHNPHSA